MSHLDHTRLEGAQLSTCACGVVIHRFCVHRACAPAPTWLEREAEALSGLLSWWGLWRLLRCFI